jgi:hypothetical protein
MKKFIVALFCFIPLSVFANTISKDEACTKFSAYHTDSLEVSGFTNTVSANAFIKK